MSTGLFAGRYSIERVLGKGATATVHLARDTQRGTAVAIKIMRPELAESRAADRFLKEIRRTAELQHPHILRVLDSGEHEGRPYFVLPYMEGGTLRTKLERESQLSFDETIAILRTIADALDYAHSKGLIHRDVKPENILFTGGQACLGDFGIARALEAVYGTDGTTSSNTVRGTYAYMSPEQAAGGMNLDGRSDTYSLACVAYEMVTGMQAFIGPTPEAVIAQRFAHTPREMRVYRPSAPPAVDAALAKAFAMSPADRYRTVTEFVEALAEAVTKTASGPAIVRRATPTGIMADSKQRRMVAIGGVVALIVAAVLLKVVVPAIRVSSGDAIAVDTTRLVVLPLERDTTNAPSWRDDDLLQQGFARWRDITLIDQFQIADAMLRRGRIATLEDAAAVATDLGAGRYIRGRVAAFGNDWRVSASLYDTRRTEPLYQKSMAVPRSIQEAAAAYARLADSLLLRGATADSMPGGVVGSRSLPAVQAFGRAQLALDDWDLERADSLFQSAVLYDVDYARANLWLAQVRAWQGSGRNAWGTVAERAAGMFDQLNERERRLAKAMVLLSTNSYDAACAVYDTLRRRNDRDFAAWFGLGQCRMSNRLVYRDVKSASGWSFGGSAHQAMQAYERAFEILPSVHRGYERGAFSQLRVTLRTTGSILIGYGAIDSAQFYARAGWLGDTLAFIPYPWQMVAIGDARTIPPNFAFAIQNRREAFRRIASRWSAAFPTSSGAKLAVAVALETLGDDAAIDTIRRARALASDQSRRRQLAGYEVLLLLKFGLPDDTGRLRRASLLADSLISRASDVTAADAEILTHVAMMVGRCGAAEQFAARTVQRPGPQAVKTEIFVESQRLLARIGAGCSVPGARLTAFATLIDRESRTVPESQRQLLFERWLSRPVLLSATAHGGAFRSLTAQSPDPFVKALWSYGSSNTEATRQALRDALRPPEDTLTPPTPDITLPRARAALTIGDTTGAIAWLEVTLTSVRAYDPQVLSENMCSGPLVRAAVLRADLAKSQGDVVAARKWAAAVTILLEHSDADLQPEVLRMKSYQNH